MLDHALQLAGRRWRIFPVHSIHFAGDGSIRCSCGKPDCGQPGKHPRIKAWQKQATSDSSVVTRWWTKWPTANIALATGKQDDGTWILVSDVDDTEGLEQLKRVASLFGGFGETLVCATGRGIHLYLRGELSGTRQLGKLLLRGAGGYVIVPSSIHKSGKRYTWVDPLAPIAECPRAFLQYANAGVQAQKIKGEFNLGTPPPWLKTDNNQSIVRGLSTSLREPWTQELEDKIKSALAQLKPDCPRQPWLQIGMALHWLNWERPDGTDRGFELWDQWSSGAPDKYSRADTEARWRSFGKRAGITIGSLFKLAREAGWVETIVPSTAGQNIAGTPAGQNTDSSGQTFNPFQLNGVPTSLMPAWTPDNITFPDPDMRRPRNPQGNRYPKPTARNTQLAIGGLHVNCAHDVFHNKIQIGGRAIEQWQGDVTDPVLHVIRHEIVRTYDFEPSLNMTKEAIVTQATYNQFDPIRDYLNSLEWDGRPRIGSWLTDYLKAERTALTDAVGEIVLAAAVRRVFRPGCKFDYILVLEGPERQGKSVAIEMLAGRENFSDQSILSKSEREQQELLQGVWMFEISELQGMRRAEVEHMKAFASRTTDRARPAWGHFREDRPRRTVFIGTTNEWAYLRGQTGNRRFWGVQVGVNGKFELDRLQADRDQLWAEAVMREKKYGHLDISEQLWVEMLAEQERRRLIDPLEDELDNLTSGSLAKLEHNEIGAEFYRIATKTVVHFVLNTSRITMTDYQYKRIGDAMRRLGWDGPKQVKIDGINQRGYEKLKNKLPGNGTGSTS